MKKLLTEEEVLKLVRSSNWENVIRSHKLSEDIIRKYIKRMNWIVLAEHQNIPEDLIDQHKHMFLNVTWIAICSGKTVLSEKFMRENFEDIDIEAICSNQKLSESFMEEFKDELDWYWITRSQKMSPDFIMTNWNRISETFDETGSMPFCIVDRTRADRLAEEYNRDDFILFLKINNVID
jgi:hypothetical protein